MKKIDSVVLKVFLYGLPVAVAMAIFASWVNPDSVSNQAQWTQRFYNLSGLIFGLWMLFSLYLSMRLTFSIPFRNAILTKISLMRERDEREAHFTGSATKNVFLSSLAVLIFILCLSVFTVSIHKLPPEKAINGKTGTISLGFSFGIWDGANTETNSPKPIEPQRGFDYRGIPVSKSGLILFLIIWQIAAYNYSMKRMLKEKREG